MNLIKVVITQEQLIPDSDKQTLIERAVKTDEPKSEKLCKFYSLYEFYKFYKLVEQKKVKPFNLKEPLIFSVFWNNLPFDTYHLRRIISNKNKNPTDFSFLIKKSLYILKSDSPKIEATQTKKAITGESKISKKFEPINLDKCFNTIEYIQKGILKFPTPIIYTGMID